MPKQTRLNFSKQPTTASKRRKRDTDDETDEQNERPPQRPKPTRSSEATPKTAKKQTSPIEPSNHDENTTPNVESSTSEPTNPTSTTKFTPHITLSYAKASLFASPPRTLLCHATNAQGSWGAGIALAFKKILPIRLQNLRIPLLKMVRNFPARNNPPDPASKQIPVESRT